MGGIMKCRSENCRADVRIIKSKKTSRNIIVDAQAVAADGVRQLVFFDGAVGKEHPTRPAQITHGYVDHHATCASVGEWRKARQ